MFISKFYLCVHDVGGVEDVGTSCRLSEVLVLIAEILVIDV